MSNNDETLRKQFEAEHEFWLGFKPERLYMPDNDYNEQSEYLWNKFKERTTPTPHTEVVEQKRNLPIVRLNSHAPKLPDETEVKLFLSNEAIDRMERTHDMKGWEVKILAINPRLAAIQPVGLSEDEAVEIMVKAAFGKPGTIDSRVCMKLAYRELMAAMNKGAK